MSGTGAVVGGRYRLVNRLATGGMGTVWEAHDERLQRTVALKQLRLQPGLSKADTDVAIQRAMREARITARLHHPNAVQVYDIVDDDGQPSLVMQYVPSTSLQDIIRDRGPLPRSRGRPHRHPGGRRAGRSPPGRDRAPRRQARQRADRRRRHVRRSPTSASRTRSTTSRSPRPAWSPERRPTSHPRSPAVRSRVSPRTSTRSAPRCTWRWRAHRRSAPTRTRWPCCTASRRPNPRRPCAADRWPRYCAT